MTDKEKDLQRSEQELLLEQDDTVENETNYEVDEAVDDLDEVELENEIEDVEDEFQEVELSRTESEAAKAVPMNSSSSTKVWMIASIVLLAALIYALIQPPFGNKSESVASVNGVSISKDMLYDEMIETGGSSILENMIVEEVLNQKAVETGVTVTEKDIDEEINMFKKGYAAEEWEAVLAQNGTTEEQLRSDIVIQIQVRKLLESKTTVTDEEITTFFEENKEAMTTGDTAPTLEEKKEEIRYQLVNQKVSELAQAYIEEAKTDAKIENSLILPTK